MVSVHGGAGVRAAPPPTASATLFVAVLAVLTLVRLVGLQFSAVNIGVDEAQYWSWSHELAFGYFSKPPLIAWLNWLSGLACGDGVACIRSPAPLLYAGTSLLVYATARALYGETAGFWAGLTMATGPAVVFSARMMTTDVPLLFFWALALVAYVRLMRGGGWRWSAVLAVAFGFGMLAKYAMVYFILGVVGAAAFSAEARGLLKNPRLWLGLAAGAAIFGPNILWNMENGLATAHATAAYVDTDGWGLHVHETIEFVLAQFAVFGPVVFATLLVLFFRFGALGAYDRVMMAFAAPPLVLVVLGGLYSGSAYANWAATGVIAATIVTAAYLVRGRWWRTLAAGVAFGLLVQAFLLVADAVAERVSIPPLGEDADVLYERLLGWEGLGERVGQMAEANGAASIVTEGRSAIATLTYYRRDDPRPIYVWPRHPTPVDPFEFTSALDASAPEPMLFLSGCPQAARLEGTFAEVADLGALTMATGPTTSRTYYAFLLAGRRGKIGTLAPCQ
jgi:hypothetical protein